MPAFKNDLPPDEQIRPVAHFVVTERGKGSPQGLGNRGEPSCEISR